MLLVLCPPAEAWRGLLLWLNCGLSAWNSLHQGGRALFSVAATQESVLAVSVLAAFLLVQLLQWLAARRLASVGWLFIFLPMLLGLLTGTFSLLGALFSTAGFLGLWMSPKGEAPGRQVLRLFALCAAALFLCALFVPRGEYSAVTHFRQAAALGVHTLRYGEDELPQGRLDQADKLHQDRDDRLTVQTSQEKAVYLRGFSGAEYQDGVWTPLPDSAYTAEYAGMLEWLAQQGFDPLTQPAAYYALCDEESRPEENTLLINVSGAARCYIYAPSTLSQLFPDSARDDQDARLAPKGLFGAKHYTVSELSSARPAELTVRADWVTAPETEEQQRYAQAEAVYREFVHQRYTAVDEGLSPLLQELFWDEYDPESDGVYSALDRIRTVLKSRVTYADSPAAPPEGAEPIRAFLTGQCPGNAVLYASAAVQALRSHGIPARYVEGYYYSAADAAAGEFTLTGENAHAWAEVYFDGVGWLPVDVTPGYYYDAVTLQQMVALPDTIRKTAALDDGAGASDVVTDDGAAGGHHLPEPVLVLRDSLLILLGVAAADPKGRLLLARKRLFALLAIWGVDACLGWNAEETDRRLAGRFPDIAPGDYCRVSALLEKTIYGDLPPEPFEERTVLALVDKLSGPARPGRHLIDWKLRYSRLLPLALLTPRRTDRAAAAEA